MRKRFGKRAPKDDGSEGTSPAKRRFPRLRLWVAFLVLLGVGGIVFGFYRFNQTPAVGIIDHTPPAPEQDTKGAASPAHFKSTTIAFDYPAHYATVENRPASPPITEQYMLIEQTRRISVAVKKPPAAEPFTEDSAYKFRKIAQEYTETAETIAGLPVKKMSKKDSSEITYFIPGQGIYAIIAATSSRPNQDFEAEMAALVQSFVWVR